MHRLILALLRVALALTVDAVRSELEKHMKNPPATPPTPPASQWDGEQTVP